MRNLVTDSAGVSVRYVGPLESMRAAERLWLMSVLGDETLGFETRLVAAGLSALTMASYRGQPTVGELTHLLQVPTEIVQGAVQVLMTWGYAFACDDPSCAPVGAVHKQLGDLEEVAASWPDSLADD